MKDIECGNYRLNLFVIYLIVSLGFITSLLILLITLRIKCSEIKSVECHGMPAPGLMPGGLNRSIDPCEDFREFSCGIWLDTHTNTITKSTNDLSVLSVKQLEERNVKQKIIFLINTADENEDEIDENISVDFKMKRYYESCMATRRIEYDEGKPLKKIFNELGGWVALNNFRKEEFKFSTVLQIIHSEYGVAPLFKIEVVVDPFAPSKRIIKISPTELTLPNKSYYTRRYKDLMAIRYNSYVQNVIRILEVPSLDADTSNAESIFNFEGRIAEVLPDFNFLTRTKNYVKISVDELSRLSSAIPWYDLLRSRFRRGNITSHTEVTVTSLDYLKSISKIVSTTEKSVLNNYLMWTLTQKYIPYLSKDFVLAQERFSISDSERKISRWEFCLDEVNGLLFTLISGLASKITESDKYDIKFKSWAVVKLYLMDFDTTPAHDQKFLNDLFHPLHIQQNNFFNNVVQTIQFKLHLEQNELNNSGNRTIFNSKDIFHINYVPGGNKVEFPEALFQTNALLVKREQFPLLYGTLGVQLAQAIASAIWPKDGTYFTDKDGRMPGGESASGGPVNSKIFNLFEEKRTCVQSIFFPKTNIYGENPFLEFSLDITIHLAGIEIALDVLSQENKDTGISSPSSSSNYSYIELFFIAYGQSQCSPTNPSIYAIEEHRVHGLLSQLQQFTDAFKCPKIAKMYSESQCGNVF